MPSTNTTVHVLSFAPLLLCSFVQLITRQKQGLSFSGFHLSISVLHVLSLLLWLLAVLISARSYKYRCYCQQLPEQINMAVLSSVIFKSEDDKYTIIHVNSIYTYFSLSRFVKGIIHGLILNPLLAIQPGLKQSSPS